jgi:hypothetical protein
MNNAQKILDKIKNENIQPSPQWTFTLKEMSKWSAYILLVLLGSISFSIILFAIAVNGFDMLQHFKHSKLESILVLLPILWLGTLIFFLGASIWSVMQTGRAYKYSFGKWMGLSTGISMAIGTLFFMTGGAKWLENKFETNIESYESLLEKKTAIWSQPELGTLSGEIVSVDGDVFKMKDWKNQLWTILTPDAFIAPVLEIQQGVQVKMNGKLKSELVFKAEKIRPWGGAPGKCAQ